MATINQIRKQVETSAKRLEGFNAKVNMYAERAAKNLALASKRYMKEFTEENFKELFNKDWELEYKIDSALEYRDNNKKDAAREERNLESLKAQLAKMEADAKAKEESEAALKNALIEALAEFKLTWYEKMTNYWEGYFTTLRKKLPTAKAKLERCHAIDRVLCYKYRWDEHREVKKLLEAIRAEQKRVIYDEANLFEHDEFMSRRKDDMDRTWERGLQILTEKCKSFGVDETKLTATPTAILVGDGIQVLLRDDKPRVIDARIIWAAEYSELVTPHTRYIVTERHNA